MKKIYLIIGVVVALLIGTLIYFKFKDASLDKTIEKVKAYDTYTLTCNMEMMQNDELKSYLVTVSYLNKEPDEYYKVELYDKSLNQSQIIIKNKEGVFVLTPTLNQIFKFQSKWPLNSPKPYIYSSLISLLEKGEVEKTKDGYKVTNDIKYPNDSRITLQEIVFDKKLKPVRVICYDKDEVEIIKTSFTDFNTKPNLKTSNFNQEKVLKQSKEDYNTATDDSLLYPVALMGAQLSSETVATTDDEISHVLKFTGDKNYTVIEVPQASDDIVVNEIDDEIIELVDGFAYYSDGKLSMINSGVLCSIYSNDLTKEEMISVMTSMQSATTK